MKIQARFLKKHDFIVYYLIHPAYFKKLKQKNPKAIFVSAECKAEKVLGKASKDFSIYMDIKHTDGSSSWGKGLNFTPGTYDWKKLVLRRFVP